MAPRVLRPEHVFRLFEAFFVIEIGWKSFGNLSEIFPALARVSRRASEWRAQTAAMNVGGYDGALQGVSTLRRKKKKKKAGGPDGDGDPSAAGAAPRDPHQQQEKSEKLKSLESYLASR